MRTKIITDFARSIGSPIGFSPDTSLTEGGESLSDSALSVIDEVTKRVRKVKAPKIYIARCNSPLAGDAQKVSATRLAQLIRSALVAQRVKSSDVQIQRAASPLSQGPCADLRQKGHAFAYVAVDVQAN